MYEAVLWLCVFGCVVSKDELLHYLTCPILWQLAKEASNMQERDLAFQNKLCLTDCSLNRLKLSGYCQTLYHTIRKDAGGIGGDCDVLS